MPDTYEKTKERAAQLAKTIAALESTTVGIIEASEPTSIARENIVTAKEKLGDAVHGLNVL